MINEYIQTSLFYHIITPDNKSITTSFIHIPSIIVRIDINLRYSNSFLLLQFIYMDFIASPHLCQEPAFQLEKPFRN